MSLVRSVRTKLGRVYHGASSFRSGLAFGKRFPATQLPEDPPLENGLLEQWFDDHQTGPGLWKWRHYFPVYEKHFARFVGKEVYVVEIGVFSGGSLRMWKDFFGDRVHLYGIDIRPEVVAYADDNTQLFIGDQSDPTFWEDFLRAVPEIDIIIDDGGHNAYQQIPTLEALLPHLRPGGVYLCEDVAPEHHPFHSYIDGLTRHLHTKGPVDGPEGIRTTSFQRAIASVSVYPYVVVIEKRSERLDHFIDEQHGTDWQPLRRPGIHSAVAPVEPGPGQ